MPEQLSPPTSASPIVLKRTIEQLVRVLNGMQRVALGPGLTGATTSGGNVVFGAPAAGRAYPPADYSGGELLILDHGNPTADWDRERDDVPVCYPGEFLEYSTETHKFVQYYRELTWDRGGNLTAVTAEKSREVFEAVECPA